MADKNNKPKDPLVEKIKIAIRMLLKAMREISKNYLSKLLTDQVDGESETSEDFMQFLNENIQEIQQQNNHILQEVEEMLQELQRIQQESLNQGLISRSIYCRKMQKTCKQFIVYDAGLVVNPSFPYLGASPDGKVYDPTEKDPFGLLELKNPYRWRNKTMEEACQDTDFFLHMVDGKPKLKQNDKSGYYNQVQGQLAVTGLPWCDFVVHLSGSHNINVERIYFNETYWEDNLFPKLTKFYFDHALPFLAINHS